jgi:hypothetical protein
MEFIGVHGWADFSQVEKDKIEDAVIRNEGREIVIDYEYQRQKQQVKLTSMDGINFDGEYSRVGIVDPRKIGTCRFTLYKNIDGYLLFGSYSSAEDGNGVWWIELKPQKANE